jgi:beta-glucosidase
MLTMPLPYRDASLPVEQRVTDLLSRMTREEKLGQLCQASARRDKADEVREMVRAGRVGSRILAASAYAGNEEQRTTAVAENDEAQRVAVEQTRLGIPLINGRDVIHGYRTVMPIPRPKRVPTVSIGRSPP